MERMHHAVREAAVAVDDPEGFWYQDVDLHWVALAQLNDRIAIERPNVIRKSPNRWLISFGRGDTYLVDPIVTCVGCGHVIWIDEMNNYTIPAHTGCYDPADWS